MACAVAAVTCCRSVPLRCEYRDFQPIAHEHIVDEIAKPYLVRSFRGQLSSEDSNAWPEYLDAKFEIHGPSGTSFVEVRPDGTFAAELAPGTYCFKIATPLTRSYMGRFVVDPAADHDVAIRIVLAWGV